MFLAIEQCFLQYVDQCWCMFMTTENNRYHHCFIALMYIFVALSNKVKTKAAGIVFAYLIEFSRVVAFTLARCILLQHRLKANPLASRSNVAAY